MAYTMMFYNLENLYDTVGDPKTDDDSFTPVGERRWTIERYNQKLDNLSEVFSAVSSAFGGFTNPAERVALPLKKASRIF